ncbi:unnamed protein product [Amoebophrya sp. A25]|nr:unnamed protein product [Amoebophrya sp. A25]|eukprot:GSA25T00005421001.1
MTGGGGSPKHGSSSSRNAGTTQLLPSGHLQSGGGSPSSGSPGKKRTQIAYDLSLKQGDHSTVFAAGTKESYKGEWLDNRKHGYGVQTFKDGLSKYEGQFYNNKREGEGVYWVADASRPNKMRKEYIGVWKGDKRHGTGTAYYAHKEHYTGQWCLDMRHGQGQMSFRDGAIYIGDWHEDVRTGYGVLTKANGDVFEGYWVKDSREGAGSFFYKSTGKVFVGEWAKDQPIAGIFQQAIKNPAEPGQLPITTVLPEITLENPSGVLEAALSTVRHSRLIYRAVHTPLSKLYSEVEIAKLRDLYAQTEHISKKSMSAVHECLASAVAHMQLTKVTGARVDDLVEEFFLYKYFGSINPAVSGEVKGEAISLGLQEWSLEAFAKIVALLVEEEARATAALTA